MSITSYRVLALVGFFLLSACSTGEIPTESDTDVPIEQDAGHDVDPGDSDSDVEEPDADQPDADEPDADSDADIPLGAESEAVDPPVLANLGSDGFLLRGTVLAGDSIIDPGEVLIVGELITCVAADCSDEAGEGDFTIIESEGVISPGLIDAHNHIHYNFLPPWLPNMSFENRYQWRSNSDYREHVAPYSQNVSGTDHNSTCSGAQWGEMRSLVHATTTVQGQTPIRRCFINGVRNADSYHHLDYNHMRTTIASTRDFDDDQAASLIASFEDTENPTTRFAIHMAEGYQGNNIENEFPSYTGIDERENRHAGVSLLEYGTGLFIHSVALTSEQLELVYETNNRIVWSPSSNLALYGVTAPIEEILELGIVTGLGPDWTVSGAYDMLEEMRVAIEYGRDQNIDLLTSKRIWQMSTHEGADAVGLDAYIGRLEPGFHADIAIFGRNGDDPYQAVIDSRSQDVELVFIDGEVHYGAAHLQDVARNEYCESFDACGAEKFICVQEGPNAPDNGDETLVDLRAQLQAIMDEFDRGDELLDLVVCDI